MPPAWEPDVVAGGIDKLDNVRFAGMFRSQQREGRWFTASVVSHSVLLLGVRGVSAANLAAWLLLSCQLYRR